jgi:hypothetical protein
MTLLFSWDWRTWILARLLSTTSVVRRTYIRLEEYGFQVLRQTSSLGNFSDKDKVRPAYYPEMEELLLKRVFHLFTPRKL